MTSQPRYAGTNQDELPQDLTEMQTLIDALPEPHRVGIDQLYQRVAENTRRRRRILKLVQEALGQLRLDMKYLVFDLEATRRERDEYRGQTDDNSNTDD